MVRSTVPLAEKSYFTPVCLMFTMVFALTGPFIQFYSVYLTAAGLGPKEVGWALSLVSVAKIAATFIMSVFVDRYSKPHLFLFFAGIAGFLVMLCTQLLDISGTGLLISTVLFAFAWSLCVPLSESFATRACRLQPDLSYGRVRMFGSAAFIVSGMMCGYLIDRFGTSVYLPLLAVMSLLASFSAFILPDFYGTERKKLQLDSSVGVKPLLKDKLFMAIIIGAGIAHCGHASVIQIAPVQWTKLGYSGEAVSAFIGVGVIAEIILFWNHKKLKSVFTPARFFLLAGVAATIRWLGMATDPHSALMICLLQSLHAFTFGALHLGLIGFFHERLRGDTHGAAQLLYGAFIWGVIMTPAAAAVGYITEYYGANAAYFASAGAAVVGTVILLAAPYVFEINRKLQNRNRAVINPGLQKT